MLLKILILVLSIISQHLTIAVSEISFSNNGKISHLPEMEEYLNVTVMLKNQTKALHGTVRRKNSIIKDNFLDYDEICQYEGSFNDDPDSLISITGCDSDDQDAYTITMFSQKIRLNFNTVRLRNGVLTLPKKYSFTDKSVLAPLDSSKHQKKSPVPVANSKIKVDEGNLDNFKQKGLEDNESSQAKNELTETSDVKYEDIHKIHSKTSDKLDDTLEENEDLHNQYLYNNKKPGFGDPKSQQKAEILYQNKTIEILIITDPYLYENVKERFNLESEEKVYKKIYKAVLDTLISAETFLKHNSICSSGGFSIQLTGFKIYKDWENLGKMKDEKKLENVLYDLGHFAQVINHEWDGHHASYDVVIMFTGNYDYEDGDGFAYIGGVCKLSCPVALKMHFQDKEVNLNMGLLLAHEIAHSLGSFHDGEEVEGLQSKCDDGKHIMSLEVASHMETWSKCTRQLIDKTVEDRKDTNCFHT